MITGQRCKVLNNISSLGPLFKMSEIVDPLKITTQPLHRFWFTVDTTQQWYSIIRELKLLHGRNWRGQSKVKRRLEGNSLFKGWIGGGSYYCNPSVCVWFDIPDPVTATWISVKLGILVHNTNPEANK